MDSQKPLKVRNINTGTVYEVFDYRISTEEVIGIFTYKDIVVYGLMPLNEIEIL